MRGVNVRGYAWSRGYGWVYVRERPSAGRRPFWLHRGYKYWYRRIDNILGTSRVEQHCVATRHGRIGGRW